MLLKRPSMVVGSMWSSWRSCAAVGLMGGGELLLPRIPRDSLGAA